MFGEPHTSKQDFIFMQLFFWFFKLNHIKFMVSVSIHVYVVVTHSIAPVSLQSSSVVSIIVSMWPRGVLLLRHFTHLILWIVSYTFDKA